MPGTHQWYDGTPHPWEFTRVWHLEPSLTDPDTVYAGVEDAAPVPLHRRRPDLAGAARAARATAPGRTGSPAPAGCACTRSSWTRTNPSGSSSPSPPRARSAPTTAARRGGRSTTACAPTASPTRRPRSATACTASPCTPSRPDVLFMQKHWDVMRSDDAGESWHEVSGNLPTDFGFPIDVHAHEPDTVYVVPITSDSLALPARRQAARLPQPQRRATSGRRSPRACRRSTATSTCCATRWPSTPSMIAGSTSAPPAARCTPRPMPGDSWAPIVRDLPAVLSVEVQTLP